MKIRSIALGFLTALTLLGACKKEAEEIDTTYPEIDVTGVDAFPKQCAVLKRGEKFVFKATFRDNLALGSASIDIHHNFDHHSHSTEVNDCTMEPLKKAVNPFLLIKAFPITSEGTSFTIREEIAVPADVDPGDYHFMIRLTDKAGWQTLKGISIKIQ